MASSGRLAVLDTSAYSNIDRRNPELLTLLTEYGRVVLPLNTVAELRSGYRLGTREQANLQTLDLFLSRPEVGVMVPDETTLEQYVRLYAHARKQHYTLSHNDLWIAAIAEQIQAELVTFDYDFRVFQDLFEQRLHILDTPASRPKTRKG